MCRSETASVVRIWNFEFRRILFEQKESTVYKGLHRVGI